MADRPGGAVIALRGVSKSYRSLTGTTHAVVDVSFDVAAGEVLGIAGPNGAGKSTIISMLLGFVRPTAGAVTVGGMDPRAYAEQRGVSYLPELMALPKHWRADVAIRRMAVLSGLSAATVEEDVARVIGLLELGDHARKRVKALSKGNFQRVGLAQALLRAHDVLVFDEPTHGLDPVWTQRFRSVVQSLRSPGRAMVVASHNLDELERVCDRVAIIDRGRLQRVVDVRGAAPVAARDYLVRVAAGAAAVMAAFAGASLLAPGEVAVPAVDVAGLNAGLQAAIAGGAQVTGLAPRESALEAEFHAAVSTTGGAA